MKVKLLSHVLLLATPWGAAHQAPLSMGLSRQENWSGVPLPSPLNQCSPYLAASPGDHLTARKELSELPIVLNLKIKNLRPKEG